MVRYAVLFWWEEFPEEFPEVNRVKVESKKVKYYYGNVLVREEAVPLLSGPHLYPSIVPFGYLSVQFVEAAHRFEAVKKVLESVGNIERHILRLIVYAMPKNEARN